MSPEKERKRENIDTVNLNVVLLPDESTQRLLLERTAELARRLRFDFALHTASTRPHISLFPNAYPRKNDTAIKDTISGIAEESSRFQVRLHGYSTAFGYVFAEAEKSDALYDLHVKLLESLNALREGFMPSLVRRLTPQDDLQARYKDEFGNLLVLERFIPHITLLHTDDSPEKVAEVLRSMPGIDAEFEVTGIHLSEFGKFGSCPIIYESYPLDH